MRKWLAKLRWPGIIPALLWILGIHICKPTLWSNQQITITSHGGTYTEGYVFITATLCHHCGRVKVRRKHAKV